MGLHHVSYAIGWTAWLDIAPDGVNKATALERVRGWLDLPADRVIAVGDGRNDLEMFAWAGAAGAFGRHGPGARRGAGGRGRGHGVHRRGRTRRGARLAALNPRVKPHFRHVSPVESAMSEGTP